MAYPRSNVLPFVDPAVKETGVVGRVHRDGSITFRGSLSHNNCDNNVSRLLENVLRRFVQ